MFVVLEHLSGSLLSSSVRDKLHLPLDVTRWAAILPARSLCDFETFSSIATQEVARRRTLLLELYPGTGDLIVRLGSQVRDANQAYLDATRLWEQVCIKSTLLNLRLRKSRHVLVVQDAL